MEFCPECGYQVVYVDGNAVCPACGFSGCGCSCCSGKEEFNVQPVLG